jgi:hypothetical protein
MENQKNQQNKRAGERSFNWNIVLLFALPILLLLTFTIILTRPVTADPSGASVLTNRSSTASTVFPDNRSDAGGTITTMTLNTVQQDSNWKAYVGNISGTLTLDDSDGYTIYRWALGNAEVTGEIYVSRNSSVDWSVLNCSQTADITSEDAFIGFVAASVDDINKTFNYTTHGPITVAGKTIAQNTCRSTSTFVSDAPQAIGAADFPEVLLASGSSVVYMTPLNDNSNAYATGTTVDFQLIVPDDVTVASTLYYFYIELGS